MAWSILLHVSLTTLFTSIIRKRVHGHEPKKRVRINSISTCALGCLVVVSFSKKQKIIIVKNREERKKDNT